jgi:RNA polymerase sigma-70 factor (ECF subfamily)
MSELVLSATWIAAQGGGSDAASTADDLSLVREFQRTGGDDAFRVLFRRHKQRVFRLTAAILGPGREPEAEDLTQDAFLLAFRKLDSFRGESLFSTWLLHLARNLAIDRRRRADLRRPHVSVQHLVSLPAAGADPEQAAAASQRKERLRRQLEQLPYPQRTAVYLYYWLDCPVAEIAELLELKPDTVKSHLHRARRRLAGHIAPRLGDA